MKLKYYMRGLGIGIILTTLILTIGNNIISEDEIIKRATALGMTFADKEDDKLNEMLGNGENVTPGVTLTVAPSQTPTNLPTSEPTLTVEPSQAPTQAITHAPTKAPEPTMTPKPTATPEPTAAPKPTTESKKTTFTITRGMGSSEVADVLVQAGIIKDAKDFNEYIIKAGKASNIKVGEFKVKNDASYDDIIKMITSK